MSAKGLLTQRERELYDTLHKLYPAHRLFIQVALSQLINVRKGHPDWQATRNRIDKLVADFVLCRPDLTVVAVIELDDWSHKLTGRPQADARKSKALADAGLRLIRIPDGPLPTADDIRELIDHPHGKTPVQLAQKVVWRAGLELLLTGVVLLGGWYVYLHLIPKIVQTSFQPSAAQFKPKTQTTSPVQPVRLFVGSQAALTITPGPSKAELEATREAELEATQAIRGEKQLAWAAFFKPQASCDRPVDWKAQVDCGNQFMRAKQAFDIQWGRAHGDTTDGSVVIDNHAFDKPRH